MGNIQNIQGNPVMGFHLIGKDGNPVCGELLPDNVQIIRSTRITCSKCYSEWSKLRGTKHFPGDQMESLESRTSDKDQ